MKERRLGAPPGTNFSSLFRRPVHYCLQVRTILHSPPTSFAAIYSPSPSLSVALSPPETQQRATPTSRSAPLHACEVEIGCSRLSKVSKLSPLPRMFPLSLYFSSVCHVLKEKKKSTRHLGFTSTVSTWRWRREHDWDKSRLTACV